MPLKVVVRYIFSIRNQESKGIKLYIKAAELVNVRTEV